jgi:N6-adenosine-specific RNA methylase IME4
VDKAYVQVAGQLKNDELKNKPIVCPPGKFSTIVCDPPWPLAKIRMEVNDDEVELDYPRWTEKELESRLVWLGAFIDEKAADVAILFLWTRISLQRTVEDAVERWGWNRLSTGIWHKTSGMQPAGLFKFNYEPVIIARRGGATFCDTKDFPLCFDGESRQHSRKPIEFYNRVRRICSGPRLNMFTREEIDGFERHGNEVAKFDEANRRAEARVREAEELLKELGLLDEAAE